MWHLERHRTSLPSSPGSLPKSRWFFLHNLLWKRPFPSVSPAPAPARAIHLASSVSSSILLSQPVVFMQEAAANRPFPALPLCLRLSVAVSAVTVKVLPDGHSKGAHSLPRCPHDLPRDISPVLHPLLLLESWRLVQSLALLAGWLHVLIAGCVPWLLSGAPCFSPRSKSGVLFGF